MTNEGKEKEGERQWEGSNEGRGEKHRRGEKGEGVVGTLGMGDDGWGRRKRENDSGREVEEGGGVGRSIEEGRGRGFLGMLGRGVGGGGGETTRGKERGEKHGG